jgi:hypothetical protein
MRIVVNVFWPILSFVVSFLLLVLQFVSCPNMWLNVFCHFFLLPHLIHLLAELKQTYSVNEHLIISGGPGVRECTGLH